MHGLDDRTRVDARSHRMHGCAELGSAFIKREVRRRPTGIGRRPGMEIVGAKTERIEHA